MTLDEAIAHEKELAKEIYIEAMLCHANPDDGKLDGCIESGRNHEQLAEWLEDLKRRIEYDDELMGSCALKNAYKSGYNKAIDDFVKEICKMIVQSENNDNYRFYAVEIKQAIANLAEELKAGITND